MDILVIDQCSKSKQYPAEIDPYTREDIAAHESLAKDCADAETTLQAVSLYDGRQQEYVTSAVEKLEARAGDTVDRYFISAGFGLVHQDEQLPPYEVTFNDSSPDEIGERASELGIECALLDIISDEYDIVFFALGSNYVHAFDLPTVLEALPPDTWAVCFNQESTTAQFDNAVSLSARTEQAKQQKTIVVALKGKYLQNFADHRSHGAAVRSIEDIETYCLTEYGTQSGLDSYED
jgi:hypothetical protein